MYLIERQKRQKWLRRIRRDMKGRECCFCRGERVYEKNVCLMKWSFPLLTLWESGSGTLPRAALAFLTESPTGETRRTEKPNAKPACLRSAPETGG